MDGMVELLFSIGQHDHTLTRFSLASRMLDQGGELNVVEFFSHFEILITAHYHTSQGGLNPCSVEAQPFLILDLHLIGHRTIHGHLE